MSDARSPEVYFQQRSSRLGLDALRQYAPEYRGRFRLHWIAVQREHLVWSSDVDCDISALLASAMDNAERARFDARWQALGLDESWLPVPLHPWQWQQKIAIHFLPHLARGEMVELGEFGDEYTAQQSCARSPTPAVARRLTSSFR